MTITLLDYKIEGRLRDLKAVSRIKLNITQSLLSLQSQQDTSHPEILSESTIKYSKLSLHDLKLYESDLLTRLSIFNAEAFDITHEIKKITTLRLSLEKKKK